MTVQDSPSAAELLGAMATTLEKRVMPELDGSPRHQARVVANLCRILEREQLLDPEQDRNAVEDLSELLGEPPDRSSEALWHELARRIDAVPLDEPGEDGDDFLARAHASAHRIVRQKLAVSKPGYDTPGSA